ncbi:TSP1 domain-containing TSP12 precursor [Cryptosporidium bovis]|uniref:TSP1 domain-containing TSP12 precursor n=1 Tax=Cryptosporidium bovis TaxID=310047 RepID=UPI00351A0DA8|nr:TSP1 domain-containing TSP12 precursor [Cryptosporidium bovis]
MKGLYISALFCIALIIKLIGCEVNEPIQQEHVHNNLLRFRGEDEVKNKSSDSPDSNGLDDVFIENTNENNIVTDEGSLDNKNMDQISLNQRESLIKNIIKGRKYHDDIEMNKTVIFHINEKDRLIDSDTEAIATLTLPFSTFEGHKIDYLIISTPPLYSLPKTEKLCECIEHLKEYENGLLKRKKLEIKCTTVSANNSIYFVIQNNKEKSFSAPGTYKFLLKVRTPIETNKVQNDPKNYWWLTKIRFSSGHYITKVYENTRLITKTECQWGPWRRETGCSSTCNGGVEIWRRTLLSGSDENLCGGVYQKRECGNIPCNVGCQLGPWEELVPCTVSCGALKNNGKRIEYRKILLLNSGSGPTCEKMYPWDDVKKMGWDKSLGMVVRYSECSYIMKEDCEKELGCRVDRENLRTIASEYPWGYCPFPCGGFGNITSIVQVANGIPKWVGEKLYPDKFEYPCVSNKKPIVEYRPCNTNPCLDCMVYLEDSELNRLTNIWIFFHLFQEADEIKLKLPDGFTFIKSEYSEIIKNATDINTNGNSNSNKMIDSIKAAISINENGFIETIRKTINKSLFNFGSNDSNGSNGNNNNDNIKNDNCQVTAASFGSIKKCGITKSKEYYNEATIILESTVKATKSIYSKDKNIEKPNWLFMPLYIGTAEGLVLPDGSINNEQFKLYARGSNSLKEPEELVCNLQTKFIIPRPCYIDLIPKDSKECLNCSKSNNYDISAYRQFKPPTNGGACVVPSNKRIDEVITVVNCINVCPNGKRYIMVTNKYMNKVGL